jgi:hypothetical protein
VALQAGEIVAGMLLGPPLANIVPHPSALQLFGEFGLFLMARPAARLPEGACFPLHV